MICLIILAILMLILFFFNMENVGVFFRFNLIFNFEEIKDQNAINIIYKMNTALWVCWNFLEHGILISYIFRTFSQNIKEKIKLEILISFIILYIYSLICSFANINYKEYSLDKSSKLNIFLTIFSLLINFCLLFFHVHSL